MPVHTLYSITHRASGRQYIGVTSRDVEKRWWEHTNQAARGRKTYIASALRKYGTAAFDFQVEAMLPTAAELAIAERIAVAARRPAFNLTVGGEGTVGYAHTAETKAKLRAIQLGRKRSPETNAKIVSKLTGRKRSPEAIEATRKANLGNKHCVGVKRSAEAIERTASAHRGVKRSAETRARISAAKQGSDMSALCEAARKANTGRKRSEETRAKQSAAMRAYFERKRQSCP